MQPDQTLSSANPAIKTYIALLQQASTNAPTVTVLQNTIGTITWGRIGVGQYNGTLEGAFTQGKTIVEPFGDNSLLSFIGLGSSLPFDHAYTIRPNSTDEILMEVYKTSDWTAAELSTVTPGIKIMIKINVYQ